MTQLVHCYVNPLTLSTLILFTCYWCNN